MSSRRLALYLKTSIPIGGLVAIGFNTSEDYLLTVTHSGRGVFSTGTWKRVARDYEIIYPTGDTCPGIGPIEGEIISITKMDFKNGEIHLKSSDGRIKIKCESSVIEIESA